MKISEIKMHNICPFEVKDSKLRLLFSFFLHKAPTVDSRLAIKSKKYDVKWKSYIKNWKEKTYRFYSKQIPSENILTQYKLTETKEVRNKDRVFVCAKKVQQKVTVSALQGILEILLHMDLYLWWQKRIEHIYFLRTIIKTKIGWRLF